MQSGKESIDGVRRRVAGALAALLVSGALPAWSKCGMPQASSAEEKSAGSDVQRLFHSDDLKVMKLVQEAYSQCILGKIRPPDAPLAQPWIVPGGGYYAQWLWDTMFVVDLLSVLPGQEQIIRSVFQNYWDFQQRWNSVKSTFMHGMIANFIAPYNGSAERSGKIWKEFPAYSQAPLLAWGMERVFERNGDMELVRQGLRPLEEFHEWYWRERDTTGCGMVGVGAYSGDVQHARYETYDREMDLDGLKMTSHPGRKAENENGAWYGDILIPANTAYLLLSEASLARLAARTDDRAMARRRKVRYVAGVKAMRAHMWSEKRGCYLAVHRDTLEQIDVPTVGGFVPLMAGVPTRAQSATMAAALDGPTWATPLPVPTASPADPKFEPGGFWRGDVWPAPNYQIASGLSLYGQRKTANRIADLTIANALKVGISERYDSMTGEPLGVRGLGMSATVLTMMLDGLTAKYRLQGPRRAAR